MQKAVSPLEYPEVQAHLARLKTDYKRMTGEQRPLAAIHSRGKPPIPPPPPRARQHALTLTIPLTAEILSALRISAGQERHMRIDADALIEMAKVE